MPRSSEEALEWNILAATEEVCFFDSAAEVLPLLQKFVLEGFWKLQSQKTFPNLKMLVKTVFLKTYKLNWSWNICMCFWSLKEM